MTEDGRLSVDGAPIAPGRYRLHLCAGGAERSPVLAGADNDDGFEAISVAKLLSDAS
ncbi:hypothetical protein [Streptosporangium pseudovulgare]|uniref:hypothetical protein n=1 Tax=Streptosporangium pseudovulgare TaxID=35765 RepID=UPI0016717DB3|nr:hypothetical protein [Streptosporangium pseudovulgare]